jgi:hypothetical protein
VTNSELVLEDGAELLGEHDVSLDLEFAGEEGLLGVELASGQLDEVFVGDDDGDVGLGALTFDKRAVAILQVRGPGFHSLLFFLDVKSEDTLGDC